MVKRYECTEDSFCPIATCGVMQENDSGDYVKYEDFEKLKELFLRLHNSSEWTTVKDLIMSDYKKLIGDK